MKTWSKTGNGLRFHYPGKTEYVKAKVGGASKETKRIQVQAHVDASGKVKLLPKKQVPPLSFVGLLKKFPPFCFFRRRIQLV